MKTQLSLIICLLTISFGFAQTSNPWSKLTNQKKLNIIQFKNDLPQKILFKLDLQSFRKTLEGSSIRGKQNTASNVIMQFPNAEGTLEAFRIVEAPVLDYRLAAKFPGLKSYAGQGITDPTSRIRFSVSPNSMESMRLGVNDAIFIEPISTDGTTYTVYRRDQKSDIHNKLECLVGKNTPNFTGGRVTKDADDSTLRTYRLAVSTTGEYTQFHGGTKAGAMAAINSTMTRVNGIFENDFAVTMVVIANNDAVIYTNANTDPYSGPNPSPQLQSTLTSVIGEANYDIGHLFAQGFSSGNAGCIGCVCVNGTKGSGFTSHRSPAGDSFEIDYVAHEMGHQFGGNHTFTHINEGTGAQMEPGSGSTIMSYAGITGDTDVQPNSDPYFHAITIQQVTNYIKTTSCQTNTNTGNAIPTANAGPNYTVPKGTPFVLTGQGSDANAGDALTYCWEQMDGRVATYPNTTATSGVAFRSYTPSASNQRYFPRLETIKTGATSWQWEAIPDVTRALKFRLTVRDNRAGGGGNKSDDMQVNVTASAGPFVVNVPNTNVTWTAGSSQTVTWNVAGTTSNGINAANVDILLSTDGGNTYPIAIATAVPNDGSQSITVPNVAGTQNRIMVKGSGNVFFDISNTNFRITGGVVDTQAPSIPGSLSASNITQTSINLSWNAATDNVGVTGYDVYQGATVIATVTGTSYQATGLSAGTAYSFRVKAKDAAGNVSPASATLTATTSTGTDTQAPTAPTNLVASNTTGSSTRLTWTASTDNIGVTGYDVMQDGIRIATASSTTFEVGELAENTSYNFTVVAKDAAGNVSPASAAVTVTTSSGNDTQAPTAPTNLEASETTDVQTTLTWTASTDNIGVAGYDVMQNGVVITTVTATNATIRGLTPTTTYRFSIIAKDAAGNESEASNVVNVTTTATNPDNDTQAPTTPANLTASGTTGVQTTLNWQASTDNVGVTGYNVIQDGDVITVVTGTTATIRGLLEGSTYSFSVIAKDEAGNESEASNVVNVTTVVPDTQVPTVPANLAASGTTETQTTLNWQASTDNVGVIGYDVLQDGDIVAETTGTSATIRGLIKSTTYTFSVIAKDGAGNQSAASSGLRVTTLGTTTGPGCTNGLALPYRESFETGFGGWTQDSGDDTNWELALNSTPSGNTGPSRAADGTFYLYVEASGSSGFPNKRAILNSPCFDLSTATSATFSFGYHMYGSPDFGGLAVDASNDGGATWTRVWIKSGNQGTSWHRAVIDLSAFAGGGLQLRFNRRTGGDWRADAAIDALLLTATGSGPGPGDPGGNCATPDLGLRITFDRFPWQTSWALRNASGRVIASRRYSNAFPPGQTVFEPLNGVPPGDYTFTIYDSNGNGLCCFAGPGRYELSSAAGIIAAGGQFGASRSTRFCIGGRAETTKLVTYPLTDGDAKDSGLFKVFPNPAKDVINIAVDKIAIQNVEIFSMYGQRVYQGAEKQINVSEFPAGVYFARITGAEAVVTREFVIK